MPFVLQTPLIQFVIELRNATLAWAVRLFLTAMVFMKRLRERVRRGFITCSVRIWKSPHVKVGGRYRMDEGEIVIDSVELISLQDITSDLAIESGFESRIDLLKVAKHGTGDNVYLIRFHYILSTVKPPGKRSRAAG
jgi:hypothetical protein